MTNSRISGLQVLDSLLSGIALVGGGNIIEANVVRRSRDTGIVVVDTFGVDATIVRLNRAEDNLGGGIGLLMLGNGSLVSRNVALRNTGRGLDIDGTNVSVDRNRAEFNGDAGFTIFGTGVIASRNIANGNGRNHIDGNMDGIIVGCTECRLDRNRSFSNAAFGIFDDSTFKETNVYTDNLCGGNALGDSSLPGLCR